MGDFSKYGNGCAAVLESGPDELGLNVETLREGLE